MMKQKFIILLLVSICFEAEAQLNNAIFNGGIGQGFDAMFYYSQSNNSIFSGSYDDGFSNKGDMTVLNSSIYKGGIDDGFYSQQVKEKIHNTIFYGGLNDGWSAQSFWTNQNSNIWRGGTDDGWSSTKHMADANNVVFNGGTDDGFSSSGISKMKWNGIFSDEWLMAANWTPNIVPGKNDAAWIPNVKTHYPILKVGELGLSLNKTYTCKALYIEPFALVTLNKDVSFISNGYLSVEGTLDFLGVGLTSFEVLDGAILDVKIGGLLNIVEQ